MPETFDPPRGPCYADLKGKIALVTGGGTGIGRGICLRLAQEGMHVFLCGRRETKLQETTQWVEAMRGNATPIVADVSKEDEAERLFKQILEQAPTLDVLVHNAAILGGRPFLQTDSAMWHEFFAINIDSAYYLAKRAAQIMVPRQSGALVFISTIGATRAHYGMPAYDSSKGAMDSLTRALGIELAQYRIRVNAISPGPIPGRDASLSPNGVKRWSQLAFEKSIPYDQYKHSHIPLGRFGTPAEIAAVTAFLVSMQSSYITGQVIAVDGGATAQLAPRGIDI